MKHLILYVVLILSLLSCEKKIDWPIDSVNADLIVVEGTITDQKKSHLIQLSRPVLNLNDIPEAVTGAELQILFKQENDTIRFSLTEDPDHPGNYYTPETFQGITWKTYVLSINYEGRYYYAYDYLKGVTPAGIINGFSPVENDLYKLNLSYDPFVSPDPAIYYINLDWSHLTDTTTAPNGTKKARLVYYSLPAIDVNGLFPGGYEDVYFPAGTIVIQEKFSISGQYAEYLRTMLAETHWHGGLFDTNPANVETNLSEGATGYFSACGYLADTIVFIP